MFMLLLHVYYSKTIAQKVFDNIHNFLSKRYNI